MLEFIFSFLLNYTPALSVFIFSIIILIVINIFYKVLVNQNDAKQIKQRSKEISAHMKEAQKAKDSDKSKKLMGELLQNNNRMMRLTIKPMIVSLIVVILLLPSLSTFYGDKTVALQDNVGNVTLEGGVYQIEKSDSLVRVAGGDCMTPCTAELSAHTYKITQENNGVKFAMIVATLPVALPFFGSTFGWLGWYIICSIPLVVIIRKAMKNYM